jgi:hypothetical protein
MNTKSAFHLIALSAVAATSLSFFGCMSQEARTSRVEDRQERIDSRTSARQERWRIRGEHEDARAAARFNSW